MKKAEIEKKKQDLFRISGRRLLDLKDRLCAILEKAAGEDSPVFEAMLLGEKTDLDSELKLRYQMGGDDPYPCHFRASYQYSGHGAFSAFKENRIWKYGSGDHFPWDHAAVRDADRRQRVGHESRVYVPSFSRREDHRKKLRSSDSAGALSAILLLLDSPAYLYSSSFLCPLGRVVGLGAVSPFLLEITGTKKKLFKSFLSSPLCAACPLCLLCWFFFGEVSLAGIFLNLFVLPTVSGVLISGLCTCLLGLFSMKSAVIAALPGRALLFLYEQSCILAGKLPFCTWVGGLPEIWQSLFYYGCLVLGDRRGSMDGASAGWLRKTGRRCRSESGINGGHCWKGEESWQKNGGCTMGRRQNKSKLCSAFPAGGAVCGHPGTVLEGTGAVFGSPCLGRGAGRRDRA